MRRFQWLLLAAVVACSDSTAPPDGRLATPFALSRPGVLYVDLSQRSHTGDTNLTVLEAFEVPALWQGGRLYAVEVEAVFTGTGTTGTKEVGVQYNDMGLGITMPSGTQSMTIKVVFVPTGFHAMKGTYSLPDAMATAVVLSSPLDNDTPRDVTFSVDLASATDTVALRMSKVTWLAEGA